MRSISYYNCSATGVALLAAHIRYGFRWTSEISAVAVAVAVAVRAMIVDSRKYTTMKCVSSCGSRTHKIIIMLNTCN